MRLKYYYFFNYYNNVTKFNKAMFPAKKGKHSLFFFFILEKIKSIRGPPIYLLIKKNR